MYHILSRKKYERGKNKLVEFIFIFHFHKRENRGSLPWKPFRRTKTRTWEEGMNCVKALSLNKTLNLI